MHQSIDKKNKVIIYIIFLLILSTTSGKFLKQQKKYTLKINNIKVFGLTVAKNLELRNDLKGIFNQNIFFLGKEEIDRIINKYDIIDQYNIKKVYPSSLNINIKPAKFLAKITNYNNLIVGSNGKLIPVEKNDIILPYIFGEFNSKKFLEFTKNIELSKFNFTEFKSVYFFPSNRWDILTINNVLIKLPENDVSQSLNMAYKIIGNTQFKDKDTIDLRVKGRLIIK